LRLSTGQSSLMAKHQYQQKHSVRTVSAVVKNINVWFSKAIWRNSAVHNQEGLIGILLSRREVLIPKTFQSRT